MSTSYIRIIEPIINHSQEEGQGSVLRELWGYCTEDPLLLTEMILCCVYAGISNFIPSFLFRMKAYERTIPYQETANGDILLDLYIDRSLVEKETIPSWLLHVIAYIFPIIIIVLVGYFYGRESSSRRRCDIHSGICTLLFSLGSTSILTSFGKDYVGYFRPNFYEYCGYDVDSMSCDNQDNANPRKSFPSGHASMSFGSMAVLTLFLLGKFGWNREVLATPVEVTALRHSPEESTQEERTHSTNRKMEITKMFIKRRMLACLACMPMLVAMFIAFSRVHDDMHHPADVVAGAIIGMGCALFAYGLWYPALSSSVADMPLTLIYEHSANQQVQDSPVS